MNNGKCFENQGTLKKIAKIIFVLFIILQPIFDIYMSLFDEKISVMGISVATIARFLIVFAMVMCVIVDTLKSKLTLGFIIYLFLTFVYTIIHHINAQGFSVQLPLAEYSVLGELFYIARMCIPMSLIYVIYNIKLTYKDIRLMITTVSIIISSVIIVSNLFKFGYVAYSLKKIVISNNMISWFTGIDTNWKMLTCRGLFQSTNQLSAVMLIILPVLLHISFKEKKLVFWIAVLMQVVAMINLGTRIASIGGLLVFFGMVFLFVLENVINKQNFRKQLKNAVCFLMVSVIIGIIVLYAPIVRRSSEAPLFNDIIYEDNLGDDSSDNFESSSVNNENSSDDGDGSDVDKNDGDNAISAQEKEQYIKENFGKANINNLFILHAYPYTDDSDFWYNLIKNVPNSEYMGNRKLRGFIIDRIFERDGRVSNYLFGISHTRSSSFIWPERDIETHFDSLGIVGFVLFIGPYFAIIIISLWRFLRKFKYNLRISSCVYLIASVLGMLIGYFSGHVLNEIFPFTLLSLMCGMAITSSLNLKDAEEQQ